MNISYRILNIIYVLKLNLKDRIIEYFILLINIFVNYEIDHLNYYNIWKYYNHFISIISIITFIKSSIYIK